MVGVQYMICHWATNRTDPQNLLSTTLDVLLQNLIESLLDFPILLIQPLHGLCTTFPHLSCDPSCDVTL